MARPMATNPACSRPMEPLVTAHDVAVSFSTGAAVLGGRWQVAKRVDALRGIDLVLRPGEVVGVLGPNGAGKSTLFGVLAGLNAPQAGAARVLGLSPSNPELAPRVGFQTEGELPLQWLSGRALLRHVGAILGMRRAEATRSAGQLLERLALTDASKRPVHTYSTGMKRRIALAAALLSSPELLLLDEPTSGLDPVGSEVVSELLREFVATAAPNGKPRAILMASHLMQEVEQCCTRIVVLHRGRIVRTGTIDELLGTGTTRFKVQGPNGTALDAATEKKIEAAIQAAGGTVVEQAPAHQHLFALFRSLDEQSANDVPREDHRRDLHQENSAGHSDAQP